MYKEKWYIPGKKDCQNWFKSIKQRTFGMWMKLVASGKHCQTKVLAMLSSM